MSTKVLVIDDDIMICRIVQRMLSDVQYKVQLLPTSRLSPRSFPIARLPMFKRGPTDSFRENLMAIQIRQPDVAAVL